MFGLKCQNYTSSYTEWYSNCCFIGSVLWLHGIHDGMEWNENFDS